MRSTSTGTSVRARKRPHRAMASPVAIPAVIPIALLGQRKQDCVAEVRPKPPPLPHPGTQAACSRSEQDDLGEDHLQRRQPVGPRRAATICQTAAARTTPNRPQVSRELMDLTVRLLDVCGAVIVAIAYPAACAASANRKASR